MTCYRNGGCGPYEMLACNECPASKPEYAEENKFVTDSADSTNQDAKQDAGKPRLSLVPGQIIWDIAQVREYGNMKYHDPDNWRNVEIERYIDALYRHFLRFLDNPKGKDEESGIEHYKHMACNMAFICEMMAQGKEE